MGHRLDLAKIRPAIRNVRDRLGAELVVKIIFEQQSHASPPLSIDDPT
jgi:hypothetical protein